MRPVSYAVCRTEPLAPFPEPMQRASLILPLCVVLSAAVSGLLVLALSVDASEPPKPGAAAPPIAPAVTREDLQALETRLDDLAMELSLLREERTSVDVVPAQATPEAKSSWGGLSGLQPDDEATRALRDQVAAVMAEIEEEKEAADFETELEDRREEEVKSNKEYDEFEDELATRVTKLSDQLGLQAQESNDLQSLLTLQNDRNREMTRVWAEGKTSEEELGLIFMDNRAAHRAEVRALLGDDQLGTYQKYVTNSGLGGRFSFFTAPWEDWTEAEGE